MRFMNPPWNFVNRLPKQGNLDHVPKCLDHTHVQYYCAYAKITKF